MALFELRIGMPLTALAVIVAACGEDPTGPAGDPSDVELANEEFTVLRAELVANTDLTPELGRVRTAVDTLGPPLPADLRGVTLEWDVAGEGYEATGRSGAPGDGLRFVLYDRSTSPFEEVGFVDVTGEDGTSPQSLGVHLEKEGLTRLDYVIEQDTPQPGDVAAAGFVTGGTRRVDFDVAQTTSVTQEGFRVDLDYTLSLADRPLSLVFDYALDLSLVNPGARLIASFVNADDELVIDYVQLRDNSVDGEVRWNDEVIMTVTDDGRGVPLFLGPGGETLAPADALAIDGLLDFALGGLDYLFPYLILRSGGPA